MLNVIPAILMSSTQNLATDKPESECGIGEFAVTYDEAPSQPDQITKKTFHHAQSTLENAQSVLVLEKVR